MPVIDRGIPEMRHWHLTSWFRPDCKECVRERSNSGDSNEQNEIPKAVE